MTQIDPD